MCRECLHGNTKIQNVQSNILSGRNPLPGHDFPQTSLTNAPVWNIFWEMSLREIVDKYLAASGGYGKVVPLSALGLSRAEAEKTFGVLDEDYNISRFFHFQCAAGANFTINGFPQSHISIDDGIKSIL
jgi:hypothetical protein